MIGFLKGQIFDVHPDHVLMDVQGVGYEVHIHPRSYLELIEQKSSEARLWIYTHVREDALILFGFLTSLEKEFFLQLIKVNGVGPKMAMSILGGDSLQKVMNLIEAGDVKQISKLPKVGKKTAEQLVLTLQGKMTKLESKSTQESFHQEIAYALKDLGFKEQSVQEFISQLPAETSVEEGVRKGLQQLSRVQG